MPQPGLLGSLISLTGTANATGYTAGTAFQPGTRRVRFHVQCIRSSGSGATVTTVKLQFRYNDGTVTSAYADLPSTLDTASGTLEVEHAFASTANTTTSFSFYLAVPCNADVTVNVKVNSAGQTTDNTTVYGVAIDK